MIEFVRVSVTVEAPEGSDQVPTMKEILAKLAEIGVCNGVISCLDKSLNTVERRIVINNKIEARTTQ